MKAAELQLQFAQAGVHFVAVQEGRARISKHTSHGPFECLISAGIKGQAGVELWINVESLQQDLRITIQPHRDFVSDVNVPDF